MRHSTWCALHDMLAQREVALVCLSQDRLGRGSDARTTAAALDKGLPLALRWVASRGRIHREEVGVDKQQLCSALMWAQLRPAGHETCVFPGVLPRLRVALVFPTQALGQEGLALRCNGNKFPNHLIASGAKDEGSHHFLVPGACPPRGARAPRCPAGRGSEQSHLSWPPPIEGACVPPPASSRERWGHGSRQEHGLACRLPPPVHANGWRSTRVTAMACCSRTTHQQWLSGPSPHGPGMMAATGAGAGRGCRRLDPKWPSRVVGLSFYGPRAL